ncbi:zf-TFIIB domain-containing protein [Paeniroseomonas aquatica]|uniref:TFIIB-type zinc ribbon-containing protein n=1 Tax=Paeniroseomonas aquatica TaxID=373043 RepID=UPI00360E9EB0
MSDSTTERPAVGMPCPRCRVDLIMSDRQGVEIDYCPQCRGVWLDRGELDKIIERNAQFQAPSMPDTAASQPQPPLPAQRARGWLPVRERPAMPQPRRLLAVGDRATTNVAAPAATVVAMEEDTAADMVVAATGTTIRSSEGCSAEKSCDTRNCVPSGTG